MKTFLVVLENEFGDIEVVKVKAQNKALLYTSSKYISTYLANILIKDTYVFGGYNREQINACKICYVEDDRDILVLE
jgi:hypothetical protein